MDDYEARMMTLEEKDRYKNGLKRDLDKLYAKTEDHEARCGCKACQEIQSIEDYLEEIDDPFSNEYIGTWLGF